jgi:hypothetical protein
MHLIMAHNSKTHQERCGIELTPVRVGSGTSHKAVIHQVQIAVLLLAAVGHKRI